MFNILKMKVDKMADNQFQGVSEKESSSKRKTLILKIPQSEVIFICFMFNDEKQSIEVNFIIKKSNEKQKFQIDNYPLEKCLNCNYELTIDNTYYFSEENKCFKDKGSINEMLKLKILTVEDEKIIDEMRTYFENNKKSCPQKIVEEMEILINLTNDLLFLFEAYNALPFNKEKVLHIQNIINIIKELKMENLYLFLKNILLVSTIKKINHFLIVFYHIILQI